MYQTNDLFIIRVLNYLHYGLFEIDFNTIETLILGTSCISKSSSSFRLFLQELVFANASCVCDRRCINPIGTIIS